MSILLAAQALKVLPQSMVEWHAVSGHSMTGASLVQALTEEGLKTDQAVLMAAPVHYGDFVRGMGSMLDMPSKVLPLLMAHLEVVMNITRMW